MQDDRREPDDVIDYEDLIESEEDVLDAADPVALDTDVEDRKRPVWPFILLLGALLGFGASFAASWLTRPDIPAAFDPAPLRAEIASLRGELETLRDRPVPTPAPAPRVDLGPLERRVRALETRPAPEPTPLDPDLVARMEALQAEGFTTAPPVDLSPLEERIAALEVRREAEPIAAVALTTPEPSTTLFPAFPADALREGARAMKGGGLFAKHIRVRSDDDPLTLIDSIEVDMEAKRLQQAVATFDRLPSELRSLARGWRADMQAYLP